MRINEKDIPPPKQTRSHTVTSLKITLFFINFIMNVCGMAHEKMEKDKEQESKITTTTTTTVNQVIELRQNTRSSHK